MDKITSKADIKKLGTIMGIWAHPDDEAFTSAGIMHVAAKNGQRVICVTATKGEAGVQDEKRWPAAELGNIRARELADALQILGTIEHEWLNCQDGACMANETDACACIDELVNKYQPDTILTFGKEGMTGHVDHQTVHKWAVSAAKGAEKTPVVYTAIQTVNQYEKHLKKLDEGLNIYFNIDEPVLAQEEECDICLELDQELKDTKYRALKAMPSQTHMLMQKFTKEQICNALSPEAFIRNEAR